MSASAISGYTICMPLVAAHQTHRICSYTANQVHWRDVKISYVASFHWVAGRLRTTFIRGKILLGLPLHPYPNIVTSKILSQLLPKNSRFEYENRALTRVFILDRGIDSSHIQRSILTRWLLHPEILSSSSFLTRSARNRICCHIFARVAFVCPIQA